MPGQVCKAIHISLTYVRMTFFFFFSFFSSSCFKSTKRRKKKREEENGRSIYSTHLQNLPIDYRRVLTECYCASDSMDFFLHFTPSMLTSSELLRSSLISWIDDRPAAVSHMCIQSTPPIYFALTSPEYISTVVTQRTVPSHPDHSRKTPRPNPEIQRPHARS
jgi:hypothetical protein